eukprot:scaffold34453_cov52-Phaeocystis_antarctica.AAC.1
MPPLPPGCPRGMPPWPPSPPWPPLPPGSAQKVRLRSGAPRAPARHGKAWIGLGLGMGLGAARGCGCRSSLLAFASASRAPGGEHAPRGGRESAVTLGRRGSAVENPGRMLTLPEQEVKGGRESSLRAVEPRPRIEQDRRGPAFAYAALPEPEVKGGREGAVEALVGRSIELVGPSVAQGRAYALLPEESIQGGREAAVEPRPRIWQDRRGPAFQGRAYNALPEPEI